MKQKISFNYYFLLFKHRCIKKETINKQNVNLIEESLFLITLSNYL